MKKLAPLVFFGNERLATGVTTSAPALRALIKAGYPIKAVVTNHNPAVTRKTRPLEIRTLAQGFDIPLLTPHRPLDILDQLRQYQAEAGVLAAYGRIIPQSLIDIFPKGIINIHPSMLPKYRGPAPVESAILDGQHTTGISLMKLTAEMDAGPTYIQQSIELDPFESKQALSDKLASAGAHLLIENLPSILEGSSKPHPQQDEAATYTKMLRKSDGVVNWQEPAEVIERKIRAFLGFPRSSAEVFNQKIIITKARVAIDESDGQLVVKCQPGWLEILELIAPSGRSISGGDFKRGYSS